MEISDDFRELFMDQLPKDTLALPAGLPPTRFRSDNPSQPEPPAQAVFEKTGTLETPYLADIPKQTRMRFTDIVVDIRSTTFVENPGLEYVVSVSLEDRTLGTHTFRGVYGRFQIFIACASLFDERNSITLSAKWLSGDQTVVPLFILRTFCSSRERSLDILADRGIWVFSTARSGSTWLSQDILCGTHQVRPVDESGIGRMFAPLQWDAERFHDMGGKRKPYKSGLEFETRRKPRRERGIPPFERGFANLEKDNQVLSRYNFEFYARQLRRTALEHTVHEWGLLGYQRVVYKMPNDSHAADFIMHAFPTASMVFLMRDGRDVMKSRFSPFASRDLAESRDPDLRKHAISFYSHFWNFQVDIIRSAFDAHPESKRILVRYEDLRRDTAAQIKAVYQCLGLAISPEDLNALVERSKLENIPAEQKGPDKPRQTGQIGNYADVFSADEIALMHDIMGDNLRRYGYETAE